MTKAPTKAAPPPVHAPKAPAPASTAPIVKPSAPRRAAAPAGNRAVSQLLNSYAIQAKLVIGPASDRYEAEADRVADAVLRLPSGEAPMLPRISRLTAAPAQRKCSQCDKDEELPRSASDALVQRKCAKCEAEEALQRKAASEPVLLQRSCSQCEQEKLQRKADGDPLFLARKCSKCAEEEEQAQRKASPAAGRADAGSSIEARINSARSGGHGLPSSVRSHFEPRFGADLSGVRLHSDHNAAELSSAVGAHAFTTRQDIFFAAGRYRPDTDDGRRLLAHELTHTLQQRQSAPVALLQREEDTNATEQQVTQQQAEIDSANATSVDDDETSSAQQTEAPIDENATEKEAKAEAAETSTGEVVIPNFDVETESCPTLWKEEPEAAPAAEVKEEETSFADEILGAVTGGVGGYVARQAWDALPLSARAAAINKAIDAALLGVEKLPGEPLVGPLWGWFQAGLTGFLTKLRKVADAEKVAIFQKIGKMIIGLDAKAALGFAGGALKGFLVDGLLGIVQMVINMVCFVPRAIKFCEQMVKSFTELPDELSAAWEAMKDLGSSIKGVVGGAIDQLAELWKNPKRAKELLRMVYEAGKEKSREAGELIADKMLEYARLSSAALGEKVGRLVGQFAFEAVVTYLTAGAEAGIAAAKVAAREALEWVIQLGRRFFKIVTKALPILGDIARIIVRAAKYLTRAFNTICDKIYEAIQRTRDFFYSLLGICTEGSFKCKKRRSRKPPADKKKCRGKFIKPTGGHLGHNSYCNRVTNGAPDFRLELGPVRRCNFDAKVGRTLVECKTGRGWLLNKQLQAEHWFPYAVKAMHGQALRCLATALSCGYRYVWYMENRHAAAYLQSVWGGIPAIEHRP